MALTVLYVPHSFDSGYRGTSLSEAAGRYMGTSLRGFGIRIRIRIVTDGEKADRCSKWFRIWTYTALDEPTRSE